MEFSRPGIVEQVAVCCSRGWSSQPRDWTPISRISCIGSQILFHWTTWETSLGNYLFIFPPAPALKNWTLIFCIDFSRNFLVLGWWKVHCLANPIFSDYSLSVVCITICCTVCGLYFNMLNAVFNDEIRILINLFYLSPFSMSLSDGDVVGFDIECHQCTRKDTGQSGPYSAVCVREQVLLVSYFFYVRLVSLVSVSFLYMVG